MKIEEARELFEGKTMTERWTMVNAITPHDHKNVRKAAREELEMLIEEMAGFKHFRTRARAKMKELKSCDTSE